MSYTLGSATPGASGNALLYLADATALDAQSNHSVFVFYKPKTYNTGGLEHGICGAGYQSGSWPTWAHSKPQWRFGQDNSIVKLSSLYRGSSYSSAPNVANSLSSTSTWYAIGLRVTPGASSMSIDVVINGTYLTTLSASGTTFPTQDLTPILGSVDYDFNPADGSFAGWRAWQTHLTDAEFATEGDAAAAVKSGAIIDIDFTSSSATNNGTGGTWGEGGNGSWTYNATGGPTVTNPGGSSSSASGTVSGATTTSGSVAGTKGATGTVSGSTTTSGTVVGTEGSFGSVTGSTTTAGSAAGTLGYVGTVTGSTTTSGAAVGTSSERYGTASGVTTTSGTATGTVGAFGSVSGSTTTVGTVVGQGGDQPAATGGSGSGRRMSFPRLVTSRRTGRVRGRCHTYGAAHGTARLEDNEADLLLLELI